ncbi:MAG: glycogen synthase GlgA [Deltaproteobacteria bacterium]|nr:glycogen synthase GlgA [Deltaproteobacteria bacterium]
MNIIIASPESSPYSKTGGLADVAGALPSALARLGHKVKIFTPLYKSVREKHGKIAHRGIRISVKLGDKNHDGELWQEGNYYFIKNDLFFDREEFYGHGDIDYEDNHLRFAFFSMAILEALKAIGEEAHIIHCHDWQTALIPLYMKLYYREEAVFNKSAVLFTIHNMAFQGLFPKKVMDQIALPSGLFNYKGLEFYEKLNFMKAGLIFSDLLSTVSIKYSKEIQTKEMGCGLEGLLQERKRDLYGVANGINYDEWDPETDKYIRANYSHKDIRNKKLCKKELLDIFKLPHKENIPLVGLVSRLDPQKGFELIRKGQKSLMALPIQMVFLGKGSKEIENFLHKMAKENPDRVGLSIGYDESLAHKIEAGADIFLMPSRYEPCGLNHLYSLKYGTVPVVRATGGLDDAITNYSYSRKKGNGFKFRAFKPAAMVNALKKAVSLFLSDREDWEGLIKKAMQEEYTWHMSADRYVKLYHKAISNSRERPGNITEVMR